MTRRTKPEAREREDRLQQAISDHRTGIKTAAEAIRDCNVPARTFYRRVNGVPPRNKAHEKEQFLTNSEEQELVRWITQLMAIGYSPRHATVRDMAQWIHDCHIPTSILGGINLNTVGQQWLPRFLYHHSELSSTMSNKIDAQ